MTDCAYFHYILIIDRSGSMADIVHETQAGIRDFVTAQRAALCPPQRATLSLHEFDTIHDAVCKFAPLGDVPPYTLVPRNATALLDAIGFAVTGEGEKLAGMDERDRPCKVVVLIATDGRENSSHEWTKARVKALITQQQDTYGWEFTFIGANQDVFAEAGDIGIPVASAAAYAATPDSANAIWRGASAASARYVSGQAASVTYTDEERTAAGGHG